MMLEAESLPEGCVLPADVCVIGAGPAGISLALELIDSGLDVVLLESGGLKPEAPTQALYAGAVADPRLHPPPDRDRERRFGGTTASWAGRCLPLDPIDFEPRDWIPYSGWPFGPEVLAPYYPRASQLCEVGEFVYDAGRAFQRPLPPLLPALEPQAFDGNALERFSCPTDFGHRYGHRLRSAANVRVILHANATKLWLDPEGRRVENVGARTLAGRGFEVDARDVVLATGGLEVPRLLLANRDVQRSGIGNQHDQVGRYYMSHLSGCVGSLRFGDAAAQPWIDYDLADDGVFCRRRFALRPEAQRRLALGNFALRLQHRPYDWHDPLGALRAGWHWLRDRQRSGRRLPSPVQRPRRGRYALAFSAEQRPNPDSRVTLSEDTDPLGLPRLQVDWRYSRGDVDTVQRGLDLFLEELERAGLGRCDYDPQALEPQLPGAGLERGHHLGTARMGSDPRRSVVDPQCRVHEVDNLYVAGSAVFPTAGQADPTLTLVALALRLGEHLRRQARRLAPALADRAPASAADAGNHLEPA